MPSNTEPEKRGTDPLRPVPLSGRNYRKIIQEGEAGKPPLPGEKSRVRIEGPEYHATQVQKRRMLAQILWGETETDDAEGLPQPSTPPSSQQPDEKSESQIGRRRCHRHECSFPGLLRVIIPEISFQPRQFAVRLIDLSPKGCKLETSQLTAVLADTIGKSPRAARVEVFVPSREKLILQGQLVWAVYAVNNLSHFGMQFERELGNIDHYFITDSTQHTPPSALTLASPHLDPFPALTNDERVLITGRVADADNVIVHFHGKTLNLSVEDGVFGLEVELAKDRSNFLSFVAMRGELRSIPTPVCIIHRPGNSQTWSVRMDRLVQCLEVSENGSRMVMRLSGSPSRYFQALKRIEHALQHASNVDMTVELTGNASEAAKLFRVLETDS
ncbi:MAG: hypothetical protein PWP23_2041 [Candidatus Sumerlaeota bacterium]|nr:hypothetical protein [Candidatus Sumerlaeota bacterium]